MASSTARASPAGGDAHPEVGERTRVGSRNLPTVAASPSGESASGSTAALATTWSPERVGALAERIGVPPADRSPVEGNGHVRVAHPAEQLDQDQGLFFQGSHLVVEHPGASRVLAAGVVDAGDAGVFGQPADDEPVVAHRRADDREHAFCDELGEAALDVVDGPCRKPVGLAGDELHRAVQAAVAGRF